MMDKTTHDPTAQALSYALVSTNESDRNGEPANIVDGLFAIARAIDRLTAAIAATGSEKSS